MIALVRHARTTPKAQPGSPGRQPVNAVTAGIPAQRVSVKTASSSDSRQDVLVSRRKRAKRRAGRS